MAEHQCACLEGEKISNGADRNGPDPFNGIFLVHPGKSFGAIEIPGIYPVNLDPVILG